MKVIWVSNKEKVKTKEIIWNTNHNWDSKEDQNKKIRIIMWTNCKNSLKKWKLFMMKNFQSNRNQENQHQSQENIEN